eukprot:6492699-Amphidinium_carterae.2
MSCDCTLATIEQTCTVIVPMISVVSFHPWIVGPSPVTVTLWSDLEIVGQCGSLHQRRRAFPFVTAVVVKVCPAVVTVVIVVHQSLLSPLLLPLSLPFPFGIAPLFLLFTAVPLVDGNHNLLIVLLCLVIDTTNCALLVMNLFECHSVVDSQHQLLCNWYFEVIDACCNLDVICD